MNEPDKEYVLCDVLSANLLQIYMAQFRMDTYIEKTSKPRSSSADPNRVSFINQLFLILRDLFTTSG